MPSALIQVAGGPAGGDLAGAYPNPTIAANAVTSAKILDGAIVDADVAAANKDGLVAVPSLRTLGTGAQQAAPGNDPRFGGYGTSLPASPVDGQEYTLVDSITNPAYQWHFRYNAGSTSPYKWEFIGGSNWIVSSDAIETTASTTYTDLATVGPQLTFPRSGEYLSHVGCYLAPAAAGNAAVGLSLAGAAPGADMIYSTAGNLDTSADAYKFQAVAGNVYKMQYKAGGGTATFARRRLNVIPVRVS